MKKITFAVLILVTFHSGWSQIINFPDPNFKSAILAVAPPIDTNADGEIQNTEAEAVGSLYVSGRNISDLTGVGAFTNLITLDCSDNNLPVLTLTSPANLRTLICAGNSMTSLNVSALGNLRVLACADNQLTTLNVSSLLSLTSLTCQINQLAFLDLSTNMALESLNCLENNIVSLDLSQNPELTMAQVYNPMLQSINIKNGDVTHSTYFGPPSEPALVENLRHICVNDAQLDNYSTTFHSYPDLENVVVSTYCSFVPGGSYNTITGKVTFDSNGNGCDASDEAMPFLKMRIIQGTAVSYVLTNTEGLYSFYTDAGTFTVIPQIGNTYFVTTPESSTVTFPDNASNTSTNDFCLVTSGVHNDLEIAILPATPARPGFDISYNLTYKNKGTSILSGTVKFQYTDALADFVLSSSTVSTTETDAVIWNYSNLQPFETRIVQITLNLNSPSETPPVNNGDQLGFTATIFPVSGDQTPNDNIFSLKQVAVGSFDPNDKTCLEGSEISEGNVGDYIHYLIRFQNSGTFYAENVVVSDVIDTTRLDVDSIEITGASHTHLTRISGNKAEFIFEGINLPASQDNEPASHGYVAFKIKTLSSLIPGNSISNSADIFFDFNLPITTEPAITSISLLNAKQFTDNQVSVYPNPTHDKAIVSAMNKISLIQLFDIQGRVIETKMPIGKSVEIDLSKNTAGIYLMRIQTETGNASQKIIKF